ncbi:unnamed protein product [Ixodes pacificus]
MPVGPLGLLWDFYGGSGSRHGDVFSQHSRNVNFRHRGSVIHGHRD